jgi:hypothetical protein
MLSYVTTARQLARAIAAWTAAWQESGAVEGIPAFKMGWSWRFDLQQTEAIVRGKQS